MRVVPDAEAMMMTLDDVESLRVLHYLELDTS
jgi:hypothetical protein